MKHFISIIIIASIITLSGCTHPKDISISTHDNNITINYKQLKINTNIKINNYSIKNNNTNYTIICNNDYNDIEIELNKDISQYLILTIKYIINNDYYSYNYQQNLKDYDDFLATINTSNNFNASYTFKQEHHDHNTTIQYTGYIDYSITDNQDKDQLKDFKQYQNDVLRKELNTSITIEQ